MRIAPQTRSMGRQANQAHGEFHRFMAGLRPSVDPVCSKNGDSHSCKTCPGAGGGPASCTCCKDGKNPNCGDKTVCDHLHQNAAFC